MAERLALIDLGSNAVRLLLAQSRPGVGYSILRQDRVQTRLASGNGHRLSGRAVRDTLEVVRRFLRSLPSGNNLHIHAVATAAVRDAENRADLLDVLSRDKQITITILSPIEEACLGALAALRSLPLRDGLIADLGGGSLQLTTIRAGKVKAAASLPLGAVRMTERFLRTDPPTAKETDALRREARSQLDAALSSDMRGGEFVGMGGTVRSLANLRLRARVDEDARHGLRLMRTEVTALRAQLEILPLFLRQQVPGMKPERADIIVAGTLVVEELMLALEYPSLIVCTYGVRDGLLARETFPDAWPP
jgi:exopolyphosphatase / guanosine-5'-triphosphate,3'-diphosphate pyrophosphatase